MNYHICKVCETDLVEGDARMITLEGPICMECIEKEIPKGIIKSS